MNNRTILHVSALVVEFNALSKPNAMPCLYHASFIIVNMFLEIALSKTAKTNMDGQTKKRNNLYRTLNFLPSLSYNTPTFHNHHHPQEART